MLSRKPTLSRDEFLALVPSRVVSVSFTPTPEGGGRIGVSLIRTHPTLVTRLLRLPGETIKTFELDAVGVFVWNHIDGETSIHALIHLVAQHVRISPREADLATTAFLQTLLNKGLIQIRKS